MTDTRTVWCSVGVDRGTGEELLAAARDALGIYGGMSHSMGEASQEELVEVHFDPATASGGVQGIVNFAIDYADAAWKVEFGSC